MKDRHNARMMGFIYYCLDFPLPQIANLIGGHVGTVEQWKRDDRWDSWRPALQQQAAGQGVPRWAAGLIKSQTETRKQLDEIKRQLEALKALLDEPPAPA